MTDTEPFESFMRAYQNLVFTTAIRLTGNEAEAQDIAQETFVRAYERFADLKDSPTVGGWLKTVATNLCLNHLTRYRARWRFFSEMRDEEDSETDYSASLPAPDHHDQELHLSDQRRLLEEALRKLPTAQRIPLVLYHFEDMSYEDIAAKLKISLAKVKTDIHRAREALRRKLHLDEEGWLARGSSAEGNAGARHYLGREEGGRLASLLSF